MTSKEIERKLKEIEETNLRLATENFEISQKVDHMDEQLERIWKLLQKKN